MPRKSGIDMIRCTGFLFVVLCHFYLYNYFYSVPQRGAWIYTADFFRTLSLSCNGLFMMLTGYLYCEKELNARYFKRLPGILLAYYIAAALSIPVRHFFLNDPHTFSEWCACFFGFSGVYYGWYTEMYVGLLLISPLINAAVNGLDQNGKLFPALLLAAGAVSLPQLTPFAFLPDWWKSFYPVVYYLLGAYIEKKQPKLPKLPLTLLIAALTAVVAGAIVLSTDGELQSGYSPEYGDPGVMLITAGVFLLLYNVNTGKRAAKIFTFLSAGTYGGYLLSNLLDRWVYKAMKVWCTPPDYPLLFLCAGVPVFLVSCLAGRLLMRFSDRIIKALGSIHSKAGRDKTDIP